MQKQISCCPICGVKFANTSGSPDSRATSGYKCENCNEVLEIKVNQFPLA